VLTLDAERLREQLDAISDEADREIAAVLEQAMTAPRSTERLEVPHGWARPVDSSD
jgi:hypothetical protein